MTPDTQTNGNAGVPVPGGANQPGANQRGAGWPRGLVVLNVVLLAALGLVSVVPHAGAQAQVPNNRARGEYTMIGAEISGGNANAVHVLDAANRELITLVWEPSRRSMLGVGYRDLTTDLLIDPQR